MTIELLEYFQGNELAASTWKAKYAAKGEVDPDDMHRRLAKEFARIEDEYILKCGEGLRNKDLSMYGKTRNHLREDSIYNLFADFKYIIPQGSVMAQLGVDSIGSLSNCVVIPAPVDSYGGIFMTDQQLVQLMKRRCGVGFDISNLRPSGTPTTNSAKSSTGAVSFMHRFSSSTREVSQNGRRGALMLTMDVNHPDIGEFVKIKRDLSKVTGANISVKLNTGFMKAVENDEDYILSFPCDISREKLVFDKKVLEELGYNTLVKIGSILEVSDDPVYIKKIKAKELWDEIITSAHGSAEPGLLFWDNMIEYSPDGVYEQYRAESTNPCSEIAMQGYDTCRLIAMNLFSFVDNPFTDKAEFNFNKFYEYVYEAQRLSDDLVDLEIEYIDRIITKISRDPESYTIKEMELDLWLNIRRTALAGRRTGLGFTGLADCLAAMDLKYDNVSSLAMVDIIMETKMQAELDCTIDLAILRGSFEGFNAEQEDNAFYTFLKAKFPKQYERMQEFGRRNVSWSTVAPTGTVSLMAQVSSGMEPMFSPMYFRRRKVNTPEDRVDFIDELGDKWTEFPVLEPKFKDWMKLTYEVNDQAINNLNKETSEIHFSNSPWFRATANDIDWMKRLDMQEVIQKYTSHSISSTINLPEDVTIEQVSEIYLEASKRNLKGVTVYRDGSRSGVLVTNVDKEEKFIQNDAPKRPRSLPCEVHHVKSKGEEFTVIVGFLYDKPYEVFAIEGNKSREGKGTLIKKARGKYELSVAEKIDTNSAIVSIDTDIVSEMTDAQEAITRLVSTSLRHGTDIIYIVEQLNKSKGDITSFSKSISRVLKSYIKEDTEVSDKTCPECKQNTLVYEDGCVSCKNCGYTLC